MDLFEFDASQYCSVLCGVDEAGRGPLAGDVYAAAVILPKDIIIEGLNDSKKLSEKKREALYDEITKKALTYCVATASVAEIEKYNILNATFLAMQRAVSGLKITPELVLVDGNKNPKLNVHTKCVVKGDGKSASIAAASILAKVERDRYMKKVAEKYPEYQFEKHKGYGTKLHYEMLDKYGESDVHRHSYLKSYYARKNETPSPQKDTGKHGEDMVCEYLVNKGYEIVERNFSRLYGEIDIIAKNDNVIAFVEVKTRTKKSDYKAVLAVTKSKKDKLIKTAKLYLQDNKTTLQPRFDVAEVYLEDNGDINYIENAFVED